MAEEKWLREITNLFYSSYQIRKRLLTMKIRNILVMLRLMKQQLTRVVIHIKLNFKTAAIKGGGCPKASKHTMAVHWKCQF